MEGKRKTKTKLGCQKKGEEATSDIRDNIKKIIVVPEGNSITTATSTPIRKKPVPSDYSPLFVPCTQDSLENADVLWDWNSPQSKEKAPKRKPKRLVERISNDIPVKKTPNLNFENLKEELRAFHEKISTRKIKSSPSDSFIFDDAELIVKIEEGSMSEAESTSQKSTLTIKPSLTVKQNSTVKPSLMVEQNSDRIIKEEFDFFDDSIEDIMVQAAEQIEEKIFTKINEKTNSVASPRKLLTKSFSSHGFPESKKTQIDEFTNDSFHLALEAFKDEDMELLSQANISRVSRDVPEKEICGKSVLKLKTKSLSFGDHYTNSKVVQLQELIEQKRLAAVAKLQRKQKNEAVPVLNECTSPPPVTCSPEEIEMKRRQALAKLEAKRQQEIIERKRLEAQKKLDMKRMRLIPPKGSNNNYSG